MISSVPLACASRRGIPAAVRRLLSIETGRRRHSRVGSHKFSPTVMSKCPPPSSTLQSLSSFQEADDLNAPDPTRYCQNFDVRSSVSILESWIERLDIDKQRPSLQESHNLACLVPNNYCLQKLVQLGADLSKMENIPGVANMLVKADFDKMIAPKLWILSDRGFELSQIARLISAFPKIFKVFAFTHIRSF
uniref:Transcription termination factor 3 n=1 Tax=Schistocephalus solidus TaxID=70667 RepID=A0A0V0J9N1_SCHSO